MDYLTENVAVNLKRIRQSKGMSLDQASEQTGVSKRCCKIVCKNNKSLL